MILTWDKPKKIQTTEEWKESAGFDGGPAGGYTSNMSIEDEQKWKAKITQVKTFPQIEIRKSAGSQVLIIVSLTGNFTANSHKEDYNLYDRIVNVRISMNGPSSFSFEEMNEMNQAIQEAKQKLIEFSKL